ncbi:MAG: 3-methyl-2-oxobutanoate hydroxymethyltransferase [Magnetococcales bacterium]|nr:3-methyl-2-oxobutanoate hydroxymethyltransferase [Magnetococcales bacterium]
MTAKRVTTPDLMQMKRDGRKIVAVTAYDFTFARLLDQAGVDLLLVGDSLGMVVQGHDTTLPVTLDEMIYHTRAVARGAARALVVCDLPFGCYHVGPEAALASAVRAMKESGAHAVKLEGGETMAASVRFLVERGIPVIGHVGLTPQSVHAFGGFRIQGRNEASARRIIADAELLAEAGAGAVVLEGIPASLATTISERLPIPTIGIGAGSGCDGQVLVLYDLLGLYEGIKPRFVKEFMSGGEQVRQAVGQYAREVRDGSFPGAEHSFGG